MAIEGAFLRVATLTLSDTRTVADDVSGLLLGELLGAAGFEVASHEVVREDEALLRAAVVRLLDAPGVDAIVTTGGTGIAPRDRAIETVEPLFEKTVDGFGEAFRRLSWDEIGARGLLSRATMGVARRPVSASAARRARVAATPSISGIWMSIRMRSKFPARQAATALAPLSTRVSSTPKMPMTVDSTS